MGVVIQIPCNNSPSVNFVESVTGDGVDNTDPLNPILSFPDADEVDDTSTTNKFATQAQLDQIATNESDITNLETNALTSVSTDATLTGSGTAIDPLSVVPTSSGVQSVTGDGVDNADPLNPILSFPDADEVDDTSTDNKFVQKLYVNLDSAEPSVTRTTAGGRTIFTITHNFNTKDVFDRVYRLSDDRRINWRIETLTVNTLEASRAGSVADGLFRILIIT